MNVPQTNPRRPFGRPIKQYRNRPLQRSDLFRWYLPALLLPLGLLAYGLWQVYAGYTQFGPAAASVWGQPWFIAAALALIPAFLLTIRHTLAARRRVLLYENGIRLQHISRQHRGLFWRQISGVAAEIIRYHILGRELRIRHRLIVYPTTGKPIRLDDRIQGIPELAERIKAKVYPLIQPELRAQLHGGQWLFFGAIKFNRQILSTGRREIPWNRVREIGLQSGSLVIELHGRGRVRAPAAQIPNVELLLQLIDEEIIV